MSSTVCGAEKVSGVFRSTRSRSRPRAPQPAPRPVADPGRSSQPLRTTSRGLLPWPRWPPLPALGQPARPYRSADRARALAASTSRSLGGAVVTSASRSREVTSATSSTAVSNAAWFAADGFVMPLTFRTYWRAAARTSSGVAGGAKLFSGRMLRHMAPRYAAVPPPATVHHQPFGRPSALGEQADPHLTADEDGGM